MAVAARVGVPTATNTAAAPSTASAMSPVKDRRPDVARHQVVEARFVDRNLSNRQLPPRSFCPTQTTSWPKSEKQTPETSPINPAPLSGDFHVVFIPSVETRECAEPHAARRALCLYRAAPKLSPRPISPEIS